MEPGTLGCQAHHVKHALTSLGWDAGWQQAYDAAQPGDDACPARIARADRGRFDVLTAHGPVSALPDLADGWTIGKTPTTGDWVVLSTTGEPPRVTAVLPRRSTIVRGSAGRRSQGQDLAANVDTALIAVPLDGEPKLNQIERFLTVAWESGAQPLVALTKADLVPDVEAARLRVAEAAPGVDVVPISAPTDTGIADIRTRLGRTTALLGRSGAGKSTLVNALLGEPRMPTQEVRADGKGRHTTVTRELIPLPGGGVLIDTPGLRGVGVHEATAGVARAFSDIDTLAEACHFRDCGHRGEPGCAVQHAIATGELTQRRLDSYRRQQREVAWALTRNDPAARAAETRRRARAAEDAKARGRMKRLGRS